MKIKRFLRTCFLLILSCFLLTGCDFKNATQVKREKNLYEIAVEEGFSGTLNEWILSLLNQESYTSIYDLAVKEGLFDGTLEEFIASLKGEKGKNSISNAAAYGINSICSIYCTFNRTVTSGWPFYGRPSTQTQTYSSAGSGVIIEDDKENGIAYIVTNYHVIYDVNSDEGISENIKVYLYGNELTGSEIEAKYIGGSMTYDIAVLKIESEIYTESGAYKCKIANSGSLNVGDLVIAIGNPEAEGISVTSGIISVPSETLAMKAADEKSSVNTRVIRIDAAVNSGNSGGGLFNENAELIGIVNAKSVDTSIEGMCYAIPINVAYGIANKIIKNCDGESTTTIKKIVLGINVGIASSKAEYDPITERTTIKQKIGVSSINVGSDAYSNLLENDLLINVSLHDITYEINSVYAIEDAILLANKGDVVTFTVIRNGEIQYITFTLNNEIDIK